MGEVLGTMASVPWREAPLSHRLSTSGRAVFAWKPRVYLALERKDWETVRNGCILELGCIRKENWTQLGLRASAHCLCHISLCWLTRYLVLMGGWGRGSTRKRRSGSMKLRAWSLRRKVKWFLGVGNRKSIFSGPKPFGFPFGGCWLLTDLPSWRI